MHFRRRGPGYPSNPRLIMAASQRERVFNDKHGVKSAVQAVGAIRVLALFQKSRLGTERGAQSAAKIPRVNMPNYLLP